MNIQTILADKGTEVATINADATVSDAVRLLGERRIGALPVVDGDNVAGIMSERDVIYCLKDYGAEVLGWPISRVMTSPAITVDPSTEVMSALALITPQAREARRGAQLEAARLLRLRDRESPTKQRLGRGPMVPPQRELDLALHPVQLGVEEVLRPRLHAERDLGVREGSVYLLASRGDARGGIRPHPGADVGRRRHPGVAEIDQGPRHFQRLIKRARAVVDSG